MNCSISFHCSIMICSFSILIFYFTIILKSPWHQISTHPPRHVSLGHILVGASPRYHTWSAALPYPRNQTFLPAGSGRSSTPPLLLLHPSLPALREPREKRPSALGLVWHLPLIQNSVTPLTTESLLATCFA